MKQPLLADCEATEEQAAPEPAKPGYLFTWVEPLVGQEGKLELLDLWRLPPTNHKEEVQWGDACLQDWLREHPCPGEAPEAGVARPSKLWRGLASCFYPQMSLAVLYKATSDVIRYLPPLLLSRLLRWLHGERTGEESNIALPYALVFLLPLCTLTQAVLVNHYFWHAMRVGVLVRASLVSAVFRRALKYKVCEDVDKGHLSNIVTSDCLRVNEACGVINSCWSSPFQLSIALGMLYHSLGPPVLGGIATMVLLLILQGQLSRMLARLHTRTAAITDERLRRTEAILKAREAVKLQQWEELCAAEVIASRHAEVIAMCREAAVKAVSTVLVTVAPTFVSLATFAAYSLGGGKLDAPRVFSAVAIFNTMRAPLSALPDCFASLARCRVSLQRLERVLAHSAASRADLPEGRACWICCNGDAARQCNGMALLSTRFVVAMHGAAFSWVLPEQGKQVTSNTALPSIRFGRHRSRNALGGFGDTLELILNSEPSSPVNTPRGVSLFPSVPSLPSVPSNPAFPSTPSVVTPDATPRRGRAQATPRVADKFILSGINLEIRPGQLVVVLGGMGSGKTSFMTALLGELHHIFGEAHCFSSSVGFAGQRPYLTRGTIRENVLFGRAFDEAMYQEAIEACALQADLARWRYGDATPLGQLENVTYCVLECTSRVQRSSLFLRTGPVGREDACGVEFALRFCVPRSQVSCKGAQVPFKADHIMLVQERVE